MNKDYKKLEDKQVIFGDDEIIPLLQDVNSPFSVSFAEEENTVDDAWVEKDFHISNPFFIENKNHVEDDKNLLDDDIDIKSDDDLLVLGQKSNPVTENDIEMLSYSFSEMSISERAKSRAFLKPSLKQYNYILEENDQNSDISSVSKNTNSNFGLKRSNIIRKTLSAKNLKKYSKIQSSFTDSDSESESDSESGPDLVDNIPTNIYGRHHCPVCSNRYVTANYLGEHFYITHSSYTDMNMLDVKEAKSYPSFNILKKINMIKEYNIYEIENMIDNNNECPICCIPFGYTHNNIKYASEDDIKNGMIFNRLPYSLLCCSNNICSECLKAHIAEKNLVICPYCFKDYEDVDIEFIVEYDFSGSCNDSWESWWSGHLDIFDEII